MLYFVILSCQPTRETHIRDAAAQKQDAALYYYENKDFAKAKGLCEEALESWDQLKEVLMRRTPDWTIDKNIAECRNIITRCDKRMRLHPEAESCRLFIEATPLNATIRIINLGPRFHQQGMRLEPGKYQLEISAPGYETKEIWTELSGGEDKRIAVDLLRIRTD